MLVGLRLENIALIDSLELAFEEGFTVLTGETGAGKSILLNALDFLLGGNSPSLSTRFLRPGSSFGLIEGTFLISSSVKAWLQEQQFDVDDSEILISRECRINESRTSTRCRINGVVVNRQQILSLRPFLIDLTVQGQTQQLVLPGQQLRWLDRLGSIGLGRDLENVKNSWKAWQETSIKLQNATSDYFTLKQKRESLEIVLAELEAAELDDPNEERILHEEQDRLVNGVKLQASFLKIIEHLKDGSDQLPSIDEQLSICLNELKSMAQLDPSLARYLDKLFDLQSNLIDLFNELDKYGILLESHPQRLDKIQERLAILKRLQRVNGLDLSELINYRNYLREDLIQNRSEDSFNKLKKLEEKLRRDRDEKNHVLSTCRKHVARKLEENLMQYLSPMGLSNVRFKVDLKDSTPTEYGADSVQFLFSANPGQPLAPIGEVASGGEMSRFLLALKTILSQSDDSSTLFFDEIDVGVSGRVSGAIAKVLKALSSHRQVFCVTHQPLVAAAADHHFAVNKAVKDGVTRSYVSKLHDIKERQRELAQLAGGDLSDARVYAASLLDQHAA